MRSKTKNTFIISILLAIISASLCFFLVYQIGIKGVILEDQVRILAENNSKEEVYLNVKRIIKDTETERNLIDKKFFKNENDSINFLTEIESLAPQLGLEFKTKSLDTVLGENQKPQSLKMSFTYSGSKNSVTDFTKMLENLQYHSYLDALILKKNTEDLWSGDATLLISIDPS